MENEVLLNEQEQENSQQSTEMTIAQQFLIDTMKRTMNLAASFGNYSRRVTADTLKDENGNDTTVYKMVANGEVKHIADEKAAFNIADAVEVFNNADRWDCAKYAVLDKVDKDGSYKALGCSDLKEFIKKYLDVENVKTCLEYLSVFRQFYTIRNGHYVLANATFDDVNISNLRCMSGYLNKECKGKLGELAKLVKSGKLHPTCAQSILKKEIQDLRKTIDDGKEDKPKISDDEKKNLGNANNASENGNGGDDGNREPQKTPEELAEYYGQCLMDQLTVVLADDDEKKTQALELYNKLIALLK